MDQANQWLKTGDNCWRVERAGRFAVLVENAAYFEALESALSKARRSVVILGWQFDPRTRLDPETRPGDRQAEIGHKIRMMIKQNPDLDIRLLIWKSPLLIAASQGFFPQRAQRWFHRRTADFRLDSPGPLGACHHQKVVVIDDAVAFCGGGDIATDRWDSVEHMDGDPRRCMPSGAICPPRHEVMCVMDGPAARALGDLARRRWFRATREAVLPIQQEGLDPWPEGVEPDLTDVEVGVARTEPAWGRRAEVKENLALHLDAIRRARKLIYLENQYFTSPVIARALIDRLTEPGGPEIVLVSTTESPSWFDRLTMDTARAEVLMRLEAADHENRFTAFCPRTAEGQRIIVHSKVTIIDDEFLRIGSTNLNNRSQGLDTECDVVTVADTDEGRAFVRRLRHRLIAHFMAVDGEAYGAAEALSSSVGQTILSFGGDRLVQLGLEPPTRFDRFMAEWQFGDPHGSDDAWWPWLRRRRSRQARLESPAADTSKSITSGR